MGMYTFQLHISIHVCTCACISLRVLMTSMSEHLIYDGILFQLPVAKFVLGYIQVLVSKEISFGAVFTRYTSTTLVSGKILTIHTLESKIQTLVSKEILVIHTPLPKL